MYTCCTCLYLHTHLLLLLMYVVCIFSSVVCKFNMIWWYELPLDSKGYNKATLKRVKRKITEARVLNCRTAACVCFQLQCRVRVENVQNNVGILLIAVNHHADSRLKLFFFIWMSALCKYMRQLTGSSSIAREFYQVSTELGLTKDKSLNELQCCI